MDLSIRMTIIYNVKHRYAIRLKFGAKFFPSLAKLVQLKSSICSTIMENRVLYCRKFLAFLFLS